jgi:hypothetical protein
MSKSIVLAKNERVTGNSETRVELGDDVITGIWNLIRDTPEFYPWMAEIVNDAYGDFVIESPNVPQFKNETLKILKELTPQNHQKVYPSTIMNLTWLRVLLALAESAIEFRLNIYGFAD